MLIYCTDSRYELRYWLQSSAKGRQQVRDGNESEDRVT